jgi:type III pantothenate kinase
MLLAIDVGNTETVLGVFASNELAHHWRSSTDADRTADELAFMLGGFLAGDGLSLRDDLTGVAVASVVPSLTQSLRQMVARYFPFSPVVVEPGTKTGIAILFDSPKDVGADRIANAAAAHARYGGPSVVVDFGTATTFDVVSANAEYLGGVIAPGIKVSADALFGAAARLPRVEIVPPRGIVAKTTVESVQAGLVYGTAGMVDGVIERIAKEIGAPTVVATGGLAPLVVDQCASVQHHEPWLTLEGLRLIHERNSGRDE